MNQTTPAVRRAGDRVTVLHGRARLGTGRCIEDIPAGAAVAVFHRPERSNFPDIDQMLVDLHEFLPSTRLNLVRRLR